MERHALFCELMRRSMRMHSFSSVSDLHPRPGPPPSFLPSTSHAHACAPAALSHRGRFTRSSTHTHTHTHAHDYLPSPPSLFHVQSGCLPRVMHSSAAEADAEQQQQQLLLRVNTFVQERRDEYVALPLEEQRRRGPLLLEDLLTLVLDRLRRDRDGNGSSTDEDGDDDEDGVGMDGARRRGGPVRPPPSRASASTAQRTAPRLTTSSSASLDMLPFAIRDVPALAHVAALQMRLTSTVMAAISTRAIATVHDLEVWSCAQEGVEAFAELGLGVGLQVLPVVQQYFQLRANSLVFAVSARDVIGFLLHDTAAREALLYGGGDARDLLNRFSAHYDRTVLRAAAASPTSAAATVQRGGLQNVRQLGIHVQDYGALLASLTQELASARRREQSVVQDLLSPESDALDRTSGAESGGVTTEAVAGASDGGLVQRASRDAAARLERNRGLYERVLQSFDSAVAQAELTEGMRRTRERQLANRGGGAGTHTAACVNSAAARSLDFTVAMPDIEARRYSLPLPLWRAAPPVGASASDGGVELCFRVGPVPEGINTSVSEPPPPPSTRASALDGAALASACPSPSAGLLAPAARRRRGAVVSDVAATTATTAALHVSAASGVQSATAAAPAAALLSSLLAPAGSQGLAATTPSPPQALPTASASDATDIATAAPRAPAFSGEADAAAPASSAAAAEAPTPLELLHAFLEDERAGLGSGTASPDTQLSASPPLSRLVAVLERFTAGDVVPASWVHEALARVDASAAAAPELLHRRCIPIFHPCATAATVSSVSGTAAPASAAAASLSRLAALRQQRRPADAGSAPPPPSASPAPGRLDDVREVLLMAAPCEVCWSSWLPRPVPTAYGAVDPSHSALLTGACLETQYPVSLRRVLCDVLGVRAAPTVAAWCTAAATCARRLCPVATLGSSFTDAYVDGFVQCVDADMAARVADASAATTRDAEGEGERGSPLAAARRVAESALRALLAAAQASLSASSPRDASPWRAGLFPVDRAWRNALDGLLYATPRWCGYEGPLLTRCASPTAPSPASASPTAAPLHVLCFAAQEPSHAVEAVLHFLGVRPLAALVETRVSFRTTVAADASGVLHDKIATVAPYVQGYCRTHLPLWYSIACGPLRERLRRLRIVLTSAAGSIAATAAPVETLRLHWGGDVYAHQRQVRLEYVATHNIVYGTSDAIAVPVLAEALLPLFAPVGSFGEGGAASAAVQLRALLLSLFGALSTLDSSAEWCDGADASPQQQRWRREQLAHVLAPVAEEHGFVPFAGTPADAAFALPSRPFARFQPYYPPGTDGLRLPRGPTTSSTRLTPAQARALVGSGPAVAAARRRGGSALVQRYGADGRLRVMVPLPGSEGAVAVAASMPVWRSFPMELDISALVSAFAGHGAGPSRVDDDAGANDDAEAEEVSDSATSASGDTADEEGILTFQYHRRLHGPSGGGGPASAVTSGTRASHKRPRGESDAAARARRLRLQAAAATWLRPPANSAAAGTAGDTPDYAVAAERYVYELLRDEYAASSGQHQRGAPSGMSGVRVVWVNEHHEAGAPFDIIVLRPRPSASHGGTREWDVLQYVEVKSTCTASRPDFEMSMAEMLFAARFGAAYCVYRVFGASTDALRRMRHRVYADVVQLWYKAQLTITSDIRVSPST